ncbi:MAG: sigma-70 family RNA polymerase sigma factor [Coriobacteriales bacterium]|jgi:RNA polymerase sigma-70 factor (ECF subfamily)|nr:sigma-70 family RNA polymerase sigma factor [Coriobacteriales bacterium]
MGEQAAVKEKNERFSAELETQEAVRRYKDMVYAIALTHTSKRQDADDVFQEVFLVYHRKRPVFINEDLRRGWLITTTINCARQLIGSSWSRKVVHMQTGQFEQLTAEDYSFGNDDEDEILAVMRELPSIYRSVLHLFYFEDLPIAQIAEVLAIEPGTVRVQLSRGRSLMKNLLKGVDIDD